MIRARLLIIDDAPMLLRAYQRSLATWYDIEVANSGAAAIERLVQDARWDAILCDLMMPDMDGVAVHDWVLAEHAALSERMLFSTGGAFTPRTIEFSERFRDRVLQKPVPLEQLRAAIERVLLTGRQAPDAPA
jgi:CheY-like chemotaxis protein